MPNPFQENRAKIAENNRLRAPQREAHAALQTLVAEGAEDREVGIVLPVGCGKSGCIALAPFAFRAKRALVVAPGVAIAQQLVEKYFEPAKPDYFYRKYGVLDAEPYPEPAEIRGTSVNRGDLDEAHIVVTNIQQLQGEQNRWLRLLPNDYFDLIIFDEGHHSVAESWDILKRKFPGARVVNYSATPLRADGQKMGGRIIYSYPVFRAIQEGYVKHLKALVLNPKTLKYVRRNGDEEIEVPLEEVRRLGEEDADFRRAIVTSKETLDTIVNASIRELQRIRNQTGDSRHKIIASALNYYHCGQIVQAYRERRQRAEYIHSKEDSQANAKVMAALARDELDVIVQVRKLGEGFDHPHLSVAAVFSIFANLSPFVQFVGRIMRVINHDSPGDPKNQGTVIFHAGSNVAQRWEDFQEYSEADKEFFQQLLPLETIDFGDGDELELTPVPRESSTVEIRAQSEVSLEEIPLIESDPVAMQAIETLRSRGYTTQDVAPLLEPVPTTKVAVRQAARAALATRVKTEVGRILGSRRVNPMGKDLDKQRRGRTNFEVVKSTIDTHINNAMTHGTGERSEFTQAEFAAIEQQFDTLVANAEQEIFNGR